MQIKWESDNFKGISPKFVEKWLEKIKDKLSLQIKLHKYQDQFEKVKFGKGLVL